MHRIFPFILPLLLSLAGAAVLAAQPVESEFEVSLRGFKVGSFQLVAGQDAASYDVQVRIKDAGLMNIFRRFHYNGRARGAIDGRSLSPQHFEEDSDTGRRRTEAVLDYAGGVPRVTRYASTGAQAPNSPDPASQGGTLDPVSALFALFRDQREADICNATIMMFDGIRRSHVILGKPVRTGGVVHCDGEYRRLQGFTEKELSRNVVFPLAFIFEPASDGMLRVRRAEIKSSYGLATLDRR